MTQQTLIAANSLTMSHAVTATASTSVPVPDLGESIMVFNEGPNNAWASVGYGAQTATLPTSTPTRTCIPVPAGALVVFALPPPQNTTNVATATNMPNITAPQISAICRATGTATLSVTVGAGS